MMVAIATMSCRGDKAAILGRGHAGGRGRHRSWLAKTALTEVIGQMTLTLTMPMSRNTALYGLDFDLDFFRRDTYGQR